MILLTILIILSFGALSLFFNDEQFRRNQTNNHDAHLQDMCSFPENNRIDCWPEGKGGSEAKCHQRGCCYARGKNSKTPACFFGSNFSSYSASSVSETSSGIQATLQRTAPTFFSKDSMTLKLQVEYQTNERLRIRFTDPAVDRYEVPMTVPKGSTADGNKLYSVNVIKEPFDIVVTRVATGESVFDTRQTAPMIYSDQYLQLTTRLSSPYLYGLGEHQSHFLQNISTWRRLAFWNHDDSPNTDADSYGTHPFFLNLEAAAQSSGPKMGHGVFLLNSNAGEVAFSPYGTSNGGAVTYRMLGGILDFFILMGPDPVSVSQQYTDVVGRPYLPPFWSLGFHLCRHGYNSAGKLAQVIKRNRDAKMPYDIQWTDIDIMDQHLDWTYDKKAFSNLSDIIKDLHANNQRYVLMADPAISSTQTPGTYPPFDDGEAMNVWIKNSMGQNLIGKVWPGDTVFPDFFHPNASAYWLKSASSFHQQLPFDGMWIDMNEPSSFVMGSIHGCTNNSYDNPPFMPASISGNKLAVKTVCPSAKQSLSLHYNLHNMFGWSQANVSRQMLTKVVGKRSILIARSTFPGSGRFTGHWTGDIRAGWPNLAWTIPKILSFNLFGIPQVGADICGFQTPTTPELCVRWHQLGAFYTFMRNHNRLNLKDQDPAVFDNPYKDAIRSALQIHYTLLPVLYNMFMEAHMYGTPILRPLFYLYPGTEAIDAQFMWGDVILISPVLEEKVTSVTAFIPNDVWYNPYNYSRVEGAGGWVTLDAPLETINFHIRGGSILPLLPPTVRTDFSRKEKFTLLVAPNATKSATGQLYWDDGENLDTSIYSHIKFKAEKGSIQSEIVASAYRPQGELMLGKVQVLGQAKAPTKVTLNGQEVKFNYTAPAQMLEVGGLSNDFLKPITLTWS